ncbi:hypothetical protein SAMN05660971_00216 [Halomonas cupida]|uniref:Uncharacterized protein n=1 Tax=Halomonas cupida TaxID=44933 RepID=A0A1M6ZR70_9GAMM|nr:hypothetical protein SAMN05660971_00216 [Halomonas cupida]
MVVMKAVMSVVTMSKPRQHRIDRMNLPALRQFGTLDHQHRQPHLASCCQLGHGALTTGVLADQMLDAVLTQQVEISLQAEGAAVDGDGVMGQRGRRFGSVDQTQQVVVLGLSREGGEMHAADRQQYSLGRTGKGIDGGFNAGDSLPAVARHRLPGGTSQGDEFDIAVCCGLYGMAAHLCGEGVGGIHQMGDAVLRQPGLQPLDAAEATNAGGQWLGLWCSDTPGIAEHGGNRATGESLGQGAGFAGTSQNQDVVHG